MEAPPKKPHRKRYFIKGPIPVAWLARAYRAGAGAGMVIGAALWFQSGMRLNRTVRLTNKEVERWGLSRQSKWKALAALEKAGLVKVDRRRSTSPMITILVDPEDEAVWI